MEYGDGFWKTRYDLAFQLQREIGQSKYTGIWFEPSVSGISFVVDSRQQGSWFPVTSNNTSSPSDSEAKNDGTATRKM